MSEPVAVVEGLHVTYGGEAVVHDVDFSIAPGESFGLVGESGSGKSTIAGTLTASLDRGALTSARTLSVDGVDVSRLRGDALRRFRRSSVAVVHQEPGLALNPTMTVGSQVAEVHHLHGHSRTEAHRAATESFERVGLPSPETVGVRYPHELSGGQQQRVAIAMALAARPRLLVLDEPTTGLDSTVEAGIMRLIDELRTELGFATLLISHNLPLVAAHCDRVGVLEHGVLVEEGTSADVLLRPREPYTRRLVDALPDITTDKPVTAHEATKATEPVAPLVTVRGLSKHYPGVTALDGVDLEIRRGEVLGVVGESGSGKSTFGRVLAGLTAHEGEVRFADDLDPGVPRAQVVFQNADASLNPRRTVRQVLGRAIRLLGGSGTAEQLAARVGLGPEVLDRRPHQLSGGQKQRVAIGRAFAGPVPLVVCDEPTSALDVSVQARILDLLLDVQATTGTTLVFISHDLAVVRRLADRVGILENGRLVELADTADVFRAPVDAYSRALVDAAFDLRERAGLSR